MKKYYDAVIVGCGVAGCFAALHLPQEADILMITKADTEDSDSFLAQGGICVLKNESDYDAFYEDTMHAGHYENTPESVDIMIRSSEMLSISSLPGVWISAAMKTGNSAIRKKRTFYQSHLVPRRCNRKGDYEQASRAGKKAAERDASCAHGNV